MTPIFAPIPQVGFPKITPKFLTNLERVNSRHRRDMDRIEFVAKLASEEAKILKAKNPTRNIKDIEIGSGSAL